MATDGIILRATELSAGYGQRPVLAGLSLAIPESHIVSLVGANGAGKTTALRTLVGLIKPMAGKIEFKGEDITGIFPVQAVRLGISMVFEGRRVFPTLTVLENLKVGGYTRPPDEVKRLIEEMLAFFPALKSLLGRRAGALSGGQQQMLAIARALMGTPSLLLLDEPSMGLAPIIVDEIMAKLVELKKKNLSILMVEQNALLALEISDDAYVIENGRIVKSGPAHTLMRDPEVESAYLGLDIEEAADA